MDKINQKSIYMQPYTEKMKANIPARMQENSGEALPEDMDSNNADLWDEEDFSTGVKHNLWDE